MEYFIHVLFSVFYVAFVAFVPFVSKHWASDRVSSIGLLDAS